MSKFVRNLTLFLAGLPLSAAKAAPGPTADTPRLDDPLKAPSLRPLNLAMDNLFASHRSHSSHASHRSHSSHYSGSGSSISSTPTASEPPLEPAVATGTTATGMTTAPLQAAVAALPQPTLTLDEKRRLQIMRVQIRLTTLGLFTGQMNGTLDDKTKQSLKLFQKVKGLPETGLMTTPTLNALGVPAVN